MFELVYGFVVEGFLQGDMCYGKIGRCVMLVVFFRFELDDIVYSDCFNWIFFVLDLFDIGCYDQGLVEGMGVLGCVCCWLECDGNCCDVCGCWSLD